MHDSTRVHRQRERVWLVLRSKAQVEHRVIRHLWQRRVEPYCPLYLEPPWHPRAPRGPGPLFPGYLFVRCDPDSDLAAVRYCPGVIGPVVFDGMLATVSGAVIEELRRREGDRGYVRPDEIEYGIAPGSRVAVMSGPFRGLHGVFSGYLRGGQRAQVLVRMLRSARAVELDSAALMLERGA